jgi:AraC-like DNA-binding protein
MVIAESKLMLETSELSIKEISVRLNFPTQSFFGKYFKQYTGFSPKEFRESVLKEK